MEVEPSRSLRVAQDNSAFFSVPNSITFSKIVEFTRHYLKNEMSDMQLQILDKRLYTIISKEDLKALEADELSLLFKISGTYKELVVSSKSIWEPEVAPKTDRQYLIFNMLRGKFPSFDEIKQDQKLISSILLKPDPELLDEARQLVQELLADMYRQLSAQLAMSDEFHLEMVMGDLLALYPFLGPRDGEMIRLPAKVGGEWRLEDYITDRIELTHKMLGSPLVAYGLSPSNDHASPLLLFKGTTYPTDEGALLSFMTDINPFGSVGGGGFWFGQDRIKNWIDKQNSKIIVYGKSLGGALSWRAGINFPDKIEKVMAYGAPGFSPLELNQFYQVKEKYPELQFNFFCQRNDLVPFSDLPAKTGVNYFEVLSAECQNNPLAAHADMYSTHECSMILKLQPEYIQSPAKRAAVTIGRLTATALFPLGCAVVGVKSAYDSLTK